MTPDQNPPVQVRTDEVPTDVTKLKWYPRALIRQAERSHRRLPGIRKVPLRAIAAILFIALLNVLVWIAAAVVLVSLSLRGGGRWLINASIIIRMYCLVFRVMCGQKLMA